MNQISSLNVTETCSVMSGVSITTGTKSTGPDTEKKINICDTQLGQCQKAIMVSYSNYSGHSHAIDFVCSPAGALLSLLLRAPSSQQCI